MAQSRNGSLSSPVFQKKIKKIKDGVCISEVDRAAREYIDKKGWSKFFGHGLGHGVGLNIHEKPFINSRNNNVLKENMVVTIEPAIYLPGQFGIRLEDMVLVRPRQGELLNEDVVK